MTSLPPRITDALWRVVPAPLRTKLRSMVVKRFLRFAPAAVCAVAATQITYIICLGPANLTAGVAGFAGWFAGAAVSYVISRWAWERKGRPHLLKETLPFVAVSLGAGVILTLASKFGNSVAKDMGLDGAARVVVADLFYLAANCVTFALRFLIFHFVLFADRNAKVDTMAVVEGRAPVTDEPVESLYTSEPARADRPAQPPAHPSTDPARFAQTMGSAQVNGMSAWANGSAGQSSPARHGQADEPVTPEHGTRR
jgi:putative flippase GtrA